jgi:hypothetical protein
MDICSSTVAAIGRERDERCEGQVWVGLVGDV